MGWWRKKKKKKKPLNKIVFKRGARLLEDLIECCDGKSNPIKFFSADEICKATDNFSESNRISKLPAEYDWYSGKTENHHKILIKKYCGWSNFNEVSFCRDVAVSSMVSGHKNFRKLIGCCLEYKDPVRVYDGVKKHYELDIKEQTWKMRMKIAEDIATALAYLHTAFPRPFVYRILSLGKILLDEDGVAKLIDFSFCVSIPEKEKFVRVDTITGTYSFMDDKYMSSGIVSEETDVFAIGILMQKLLMGYFRFNELHVLEKGDGEGDNDDDDDDDDDDDTIDPERQFQSRLLKFMEEGRMDEITDPEMVEKMGEISEQELCRMKAFGMLSLRCTGVRGEVPKMVEVAKELKKIQRSLRNDTLNSSPSGETPFDSAQHGSSSVLIDTGEVSTMGKSQ